MNVVIPMAGLGSRFLSYGFCVDKYTLPVNNNLDTMLKMAITTLIMDSTYRYIFVLRKTETTNEVIKLLEDIFSEYPNTKFFIKVLDELTDGPATTVYLASEFFDPSMPLLVSNSDQILDWDFQQFLNECHKYDGCVLTYKPLFDGQRFDDSLIGTTDKHSFLRFETPNGGPNEPPSEVSNETPSEGLSSKIIDVDEKIVLSDTALVGVHYYSSTMIFLEAYKYMVENGIRAPNGEFYLSLTYKCMLKMGYTVGHHLLPHYQCFYPVGEPNDYFKYLNYYGYNCNNYYSEQINQQYDFKLFKVLFHKKIRGVVDQFINKLIVLENEILLTVHGYLLQIKINKVSEAEITYNLNEFIRGWFIGDFDKCIKRVKEYEIGLLKHARDEKWRFHYHKVSTEFNFLLTGKMLLNGVLMEENTLFILKPNQIACPIFLTDCEILCIKIPSVPGDKYLI
jgi:dTDP-glucose pyrophosphorylase